MSWVPGMRQWATCVCLLQTQPCVKTAVNAGCSVDLVNREGPHARATRREGCSPACAPARQHPGGRKVQREGEQGGKIAYLRPKRKNFERVFPSGETRPVGGGGRLTLGRSSHQHQCEGGVHPNAVVPHFHLGVPRHPLCFEMAIVQWPVLDVRRSRSLHMDGINLHLPQQQLELPPCWHHLYPDPLQEAQHAVVLSHGEECVALTRKPHHRDRDGRRMTGHFAKLHKA